MKSDKVRLDRWLQEAAGVRSRALAQRLIREGKVTVAGEVVREAARRVNAFSRVEVVEREKYVSRAGLKLEAALERSGIKVLDCDCLDVGASTGGFTDCLLQRGARHVTAIDVGRGQLHESLKNDARVAWVEQCNARELEAGAFGRFYAILVIDVSFISLGKILGPVLAQAERGARLIALVKPQFEVGPERVGAGGIVRDPAWRAEALEKVRAQVEEAHDWRVLGTMPCPLKGGDGNQEYLLWAEKSDR